MRHRFDGNDLVFLRGLPLEEAFDEAFSLGGKVGGFQKGPRQILVSIPAVPFSLLLAVAEPLALHTPAIRSKVSHLFEASDIPRLQHNRQPQNRPDPMDRQQRFELRAQPRLFEDHLFQFINIPVQCLHHAEVE